MARATPASLYTVVATWIRERWQAARRERAQRLGGTRRCGGAVLPRPVADRYRAGLAARDRLTLIHHDLRLAQEAAAAPSPAARS